MDADVIIAGAGMAGATLALALKQGGLKPLLIEPVVFDAQLAPSFDGRASAIAYASFRQWRTLGLTDDIEPYAQRIEQILVTDGRRPGASTGAPPGFFLQFDSSEIADRSDGEPLGYLLENRRTRAALAAGVLRENIPVIAPVAVKGVTFEPGAARVQLSDGREAEVVYLGKFISARPVVKTDDGEFIDLEQKKDLGILKVLRT